MVKKIIAAGLTVRNLVLIPAIGISIFSYAEILPFFVKNHL